MKKGRMFTDNTGLNYIEDRDIGELKKMRQTLGKTPEEWPIKEVTADFTITNDPQGRIFEESSQANEVIYQLQNDTFQLQSIEYLSDPQPEGLND